MQVTFSLVLNNPQIQSKSDLLVCVCHLTSDIQFIHMNHQIFHFQKVPLFLNCFYFPKCIFDLIFFNQEIWVLLQHRYRNVACGEVIEKM